MLGVNYAQLGLLQKSADEFRVALAMSRNLSLAAYGNLGNALLSEGQYDQAEALLHRAPDQWQPHLHDLLYELALLRSDAAGLERERAWMAQNADDPFVVWTQARIDLFAGNLSRARQHTQHAVNMALESNLKESAANMLLTQATAEALFGEPCGSPKLRAHLK
jgi:tetratricopeptide (TPR) repeat protein